MICSNRSLTNGNFSHRDFLNSSTPSINGSNWVVLNWKRFRWVQESIPCVSYSLRGGQFLKSRPSTRIRVLGRLFKFRRFTISKGVSKPKLTFNLTWWNFWFYVIDLNPISQHPKFFKSRPSTRIRVLGRLLRNWPQNSEYEAHGVESCTHRKSFQFRTTQFGPFLDGVALFKKSRCEKFPSYGLKLVSQNHEDGSHEKTFQAWSWLEPFSSEGRYWHVALERPEPSHSWIKSGSIRDGSFLFRLNPVGVCMFYELLVEILWNVVEEAHVIT